MTKQQPRAKTPTGPTQAAWFAAGYQAALADIRQALVTGGEPAVRAWLDNNCTRTEN